MCKYCRVNPETRETDENVPLIDETRDGISSFVTLDIYEPDEIYGLRVTYMYGGIDLETDDSVSINFCPMCGRDLRKHGLDV